MLGEPSILNLKANSHNVKPGIANKNDVVIENKVISHIAEPEKERVYDIEHGINKSSQVISDNIQQYSAEYERIDAHDIGFNESSRVISNRNRVSFKRERESINESSEVINNEGNSNSDFERADGQGIEGRKCKATRMRSVVTLRASKLQYEAKVEYRDITQDTYSLFFLSENFRRSFWLGIGVFVLKVSLFITLLLELCVGLLSLPPKNCDVEQCSEKESIEWFLSDSERSQFHNNLIIVIKMLGIPIAVLIQSDVLETYFLIANVKYSDIFVKYHHHATLTKYYFANTMRFLDGILSLAVNLIILYSAESVLSLFLNFAALQFMQTIDNLLFDISKDGYLGVHLIVAAEVVKNTKFKLIKREKCRNNLDTGLLFATIVSSYLGWLLYHFKLA